MPLTFVNGGGPNYPGSGFSTTASLLEQIRDNLVIAGWAVSLDEINTNEKLIMNASSTGTNNSIAYDDDAFIRFTITTDPFLAEGRILNIRGQHTAVETSPASNEYTINYVLGGDNRLWLTADEEGGCLSITGPGVEQRGIHFGFLQRGAPEIDPWGWMVGFITLLYTDAQWARSFRQGTNWYTAGDDYTQTGNFNTGSNTTPFHTTGDVYTSYFGRFNADGFQTSDPENPAYFFWKGRGSSVGDISAINPFCYLEGREEGSGYGDADGVGVPIAVGFRGFVRYAAGGALRYGAGVLISDSSSSNIYMSTGGEFFQAMRIA